MATLDDEIQSPENVQGRRKQEKKGITIDSSLIHTATPGSVDIENELGGLGVSVYNQGEFEAGVLKQIDDEFHRQISKQDRKLLLNDYNTVKGEINSVHVDLRNISKTMAGLLSLPLRDVGSRLRELRTAQDQRKKHLKILEAREDEILKKLTHRDDPTTDKTEESSLVADPSTSKGDSTMDSSSKSQQRLTQTECLIPSQGASITPATFNQREPAIRLSSDSFNGLFSDNIDPGRKSFRKTSRIPKIKNKHLNQFTEFDSNSNSSLELDIENATSHSSGMALDSNSRSSLELSTGNVISQPCSSITGLDKSSEPSIGNESSDQDSWIPTLAEFLESDHTSTESEYFTDEDLGPGAVEKKKKKKKLRELSSDDDLSDEDEPKSSKRRRKSHKRRKNGMQRRYKDDGDEELYRQRLRDANFQESEHDDTNLGGGLSIPSSIWHRLYRYQRTGVKWLWELHCQQAGGIVGDEMGLGKTIQAIAFLAGLKISNLRSHVTRKLGLGPVLIVCPATVMHQWVSEFHSWWPPFRVAVLHGTGTYCGSKKLLVDKLVKDDCVLVTTYSGIRIYQDILLQHKWDYVILDEGHKIRNPDAEVTLACKQVTTPHRLILSGSPMQNNLRELWSLFDFVFPGKLGTLPVFMEQFSVPITQGGYANASDVQVQTAYRCACVLRDTINPYMLRRLKADVNINLPDKHEQVLFCRLTEYQCELYQDYIQSSAVQAMLDRGKQVFAGLMALRKLCNHPDLVTNDYSEQVTSEKRTKKDLHVEFPKKKGATPEYDPDNEESYGHWRRSGKMVVIESLLKLWKRQSHKVLMFSQSKLMLDIIEMFVRGKGYTYLRMDGTTPISKRQSIVNKFNQEESIFVFLLTTRVGGLGINLTGADRVVIYDPDWNPSTDLQARERAWRIGQMRQVTIYRLLTSGTIEEKIYHRQIFKQFLTNRVLKDPRQRRFFKSNNLHELFTLSSSALEGSTETSAIFAGTGSEIVPPKKLSGQRRREERSHDPEETGSRKRKWKGSEGETKRKLGKKMKDMSHDTEKMSYDTEEVSHNTEEMSHATEKMSHDSDDGVFSVVNERCLKLDKPEREDMYGISNEPGPSSACLGQDQEEETKIKSNHKEISRKGKMKLVHMKKKKKKKKQHERLDSIERERIEGLDQVHTYRPGEEDEEENSKQDDFILQKLFKKSGVHSALQHDVIMNSANPDYVLVESEANKVAKSAARALKVSRRQCLDMGAGRGRPTWTGSHGIAGAPPLPRFGLRIDAKKLRLSSSSEQHFSGSTTRDSLSSKGCGSVNTSSSILLAKMRLRNTHTTSSGQEEGVGGASSIHGDGHTELLREIRDFIATKSKVNGQATTSELLSEFSKKLPRSDAAMFKSMLYEICDFSRHQGDGLWYLKQEFR